MAFSAGINFQKGVEEQQVKTGRAFHYAGDDGLSALPVAMTILCSASAPEILSCFQSVWPADGMTLAVILSADFSVA